LLKAWTVHQREGDSLYLLVLPCIWKKSKNFSNSTTRITSGILIQLFVISSPIYLLVVTYAVVKFLLYVTERFIRKFELFVNVWLLYLIPAVLLWYEVCLSDIQQGQSELLQLTAGDAHQRSVQVCKANIFSCYEKYCYAL
jgi:hypothetical protein